MLTDGKPIQWHPSNGQEAKGSAGVHEERGMRGEKHQELGRPCSFLSRYMGQSPIGDR